MNPQIRLYTPSQEYYTEEHCYINELSNSASDEAVSIALARVAPGVTTRWHLLTGITERYVIQQGQGSVEVGELPAQSLGPHDVVLIPPGCRQRITNTGTEDLIFLAICSPRFLPGAYQDVDG